MQPELSDYAPVKDLGKRISARRKALHLSMEALAECIGVSWQAVQLWENGGSTPRISKFEKIADCLNTTVGELFYGKPAHDQTVQTPEKFPIVELKGRIPLISWAQAGGWQEIQDTFHPGDAERWLQISAKVGRMAFAVRVVGDSMEPRVPDGSMVVIDPDRQADHGAIVLAKRTDDQTATLKQLWYDGATPYLRPLNDRYPTLPCPEDTRIIGVAVQVVLDL